MRKYTCGHSNVGDRVRDCNLRRLQNEQCNRFTVTSETIIETDQCASCKEYNPSMNAHGQDSTHPNVVSPPAWGFEGRGRLSVERSSKPLPQLIGEVDVPDQRSSWLYEDGTTSKKACDGEPVNAQRNETKAFTPGKRLAMLACEACRMRKVKCDLAEPKCVQCATAGRKCRKSPTSRPRDPSNESLKLTEEVWKPEQAQFLQSEQSWNDEDSGPLAPRVPNLSASPKTSKATNQRTQPVPGLAHSLSLSPQSRKSLPEQIPQHARHSQFTDSLLSVASLRPFRTDGATPLRTLLAKYYLLDALSHLKLENTNSCLDVVHAEPPIRPLAESVARLYAKPPKVWLAIRSMIRNLHTDVLHDILDIISDAKLYTDYVLFHTPSTPTLGSIEQKFACSALFDCIRVRKYMLNMLFREVQAFILKLSRPRLEHSEESHSSVRSSSDRKSPAKSVPVEQGRTQAARDSKRWLHISSQRLWDRILHPTLQGKPRKCAVDALMLTKRSKLYCDGLQQTLRVVAIYSLPLILATNSSRTCGVWLKDSIFKGGTFSRLMDLQDRCYPLEADDQGSYDQGVPSAPRSTCSGSRAYKMLLAFQLRQ